MKKLYLIGETMGVGKTTTCQVLKRKLDKSVFIDGDWCWDMHPFVVNKETMKLVLNNICTLLNNDIKCNTFENIIFCWVMHEQSIIDDILSRLDLNDVKVIAISLVCQKEALDILSKYKISGLPIVDDNNTLLGIVTNRDLKYISSYDILVKDIMTKDNIITGKIGTTLEQAKKILWENRIEKLPIVDENNKIVGLITSKDIDNAINYPNACKDEKGRLRVGAAIGVANNSLERVKALVEKGVL